MSNYRVPGRRNPEAEGESRDYFGVKAKTVLATRVEAGRGAEQGTERVDPDDRQVVKIILRDGITLWTSVVDAHEDFGVDIGTRGGSGNDLIPPVLAIGRADRGSGWIVRALEFIDVDLGKGLEDVAASVLVKKLEEQFEKQVGEPGLYCLKADGTVDRDAKIAASKETYLVFVHGTASSTSGGFGQLFLQADWPDVYKHYDKRVLAFEHRTLSLNPIANALELVNALPDGATIDFVSHSRGGLVCELVCRGMRVAAIGETFEPFDATDRKIVENSRSSDELKDTGIKELALLDKLGTALKDKKLKVRQLVRVACPARGTTLASRRLDRYLSLMVNLIALVPGLAGNPVYDLTMGLLLAVAKKRTDPAEIPGLEAQMPESPLVAMVNRLDVVLSGKLSVVAGDIEGTGILGRLKTLATDLFYRADHDLVVNTDAMYGGGRREPEAMFLLDQGGGVNHFNYFTNHLTAAAIAGAVTGEPLAGLGFKPLSSMDQARSVKRSRTILIGPHPVVFILPGTMGSRLRKAKNRVWLDLSEVALGGIGELKWGEPDIYPDGMFDKYYGGLAEYLSQTHYVADFAYDWRKSILEEGTRLAALVEERMKNSSEPIRFIAHSMGGLVVRAMAVQKPDLWSKIRQNPASRFVMLGTPNLGSFSIVSTLMARDKTIGNLALLDFRRNTKDLLDIVSGFPGVLELLPRDEAGSFYTPQMWKRLRGPEEEKKWPEPPSATLDDAAKAWAKIGSFVFSGEGMAYVAGFDPEPTPVGVKFDGKDKKVTILGTPLGDGRVPWASGIPPGVPVWYADCVHGDLARNENAFAAYADLLKSGTTSRLKKDPPALTRGVAETLVEIKPESADIYPSPDDAIDAIMGGGMKRRAATSKAKVKVTIYHGDLRFAKDPIVVGHYRHDTLTGPEKALDWMLDERLSRMRALGVYPGEIGTAEAVLRSSGPAPGAIVIGLGKFGDLSPGDLTTAFSYGFRKYVFQSAESVSVEENPLPISTLMIGHRESKLTLRDCLTAMLEGLKQANGAFSDKAPAIEALSIVELYESRAIEALGILGQFAKDPYFSAYLDISLDLEELSGGLRRLDANEEPGWWRRLQITQDVDCDKKASLVFTDVSAGARASQVLISNQKNLIEPFLAEAMGDSSTKPEIAKVLFELLTPSAFKPYATNDRPILLVVDKDTARFPWELLHDKQSEKPVAVRARGIRQLIDPNTSYSPAPSFEKAALVIGDSNSGPDFCELPGAQKEASIVGKLLEDAKYKTNILIRKPVEEITTALYLENARILHIAAHGVVDYGDEKITGAVLGANAFFTASEAERLRPFPELVFLNCCHLGNTAAGADAKKELWNNRHHLAASLAEQFIKSGAKVVVAAGWAVNDAAASDFARVFYEGMTQGFVFADSVFAARTYVYDNHKGCNTWGAYQCYGDPDYRLQMDTQLGAWQNTHAGTLTETLIDIENVYAANETASQSGLKRSTEKVIALVGRIPKRWRGDTRVQEGIGKAYADVLEFDEAITCYTAALASGDSLTRLKSSEQLINLRVKNAIRKLNLKKGDPAKIPTAEARNQILAAIRQVEALMMMVDRSADLNNSAGSKKTVGRSCERLSILASAHKRLASISSKSTQQIKFARAIAYYQEAYNAAKASAQPTDSYYSGINAQLLLALANKSINSAVLDEILKSAESAEGRKPTFYSKVAAMDVKVIKYLGEPKTTVTPGDIIDAFRLAWRRGGTYRDGTAVKEQLDFIYGMLAATKKVQAAGIKLVIDAVDDELQFAP